MMPWSLRAPQSTYRYVQRVYEPQQLTQIGATTKFFGVNFTAGQLPNWGSFVSLYDQYRITRIAYHILPKSNVNLLVSDTDVDRLISEVFTVIDLDSVTTPASINELLEYQSCARTPSTREHTRIWKPSVLNQVYESVATSGYSRQFDQWLDCDDDTIPHYGIRGCITAHTTNVTDDSILHFDVYIEVEIEFQNVR